MKSTPTRNDLLHEIETRQDQVLAELDSLERQLTALLAEYTPQGAVADRQPASVEAKEERSSHDSPARQAA